MIFFQALYVNVESQLLLNRIDLKVCNYFVIEPSYKLKLSVNILSDYIFIIYGVIIINCR